MTTDQEKKIVQYLKDFAADNDISEMVIVFSCEKIPVTIVSHIVPDGNPSVPYTTIKKCLDDYVMELYKGHIAHSN